MKKTAALLLMLFLAAAPVSALVFDNAALIFPALETGAGPKALGMGEAFTAVADDASAVYWNPAGMAFMGKASVSGTFDKWLDDTFYSYIIGGIPFQNGGGLGFSAAYMNMGAFEKRDELGNIISGEIISYIFTASLGYSQKFGDNVSAGISCKGIVQDTGGIAQAAAAGDAGILVKFGPFSAGVAGQNIGGGPKYPLPVIIKGGIAFKALDVPGQSLILAADIRSVLKDTTYCMFGLEYGIMNALFLRSGYELSGAEKTLGGMTGFSAGAGVRLDPVQFDYAMVPFGDLGTTHRISLSLSWGGEKPKKTDNDVPVLKKSPTTAELYKQGVYYENQKDYREAAVKYNAFLKIKPKDAAVMKRLGIVYFKAGKKDWAIKVLEEAFILDPDDKKLEKFLKNNRNK